MSIDYVLPLKWSDDDDVAELTGYLEDLARHANVIVVDGSPPPLYAAHARAWRGIATHIRPEGSSANGKVSGVDTGVRRATAERVVIADDDVRYTPEQLHRVASMLDGDDLVGPQNVFDPAPWHARWDTARSLLNRAVAADYPGTFAVRRSTYLAMGGYDGDVLFENLELMRTVKAWGGTVRRPLDVYVVRRPPRADRFRDQRVRQAYDDLAQPWRMAAFLCVAPATARALARRRPEHVLAAAVALVALAEVGRRRAGGAAVFAPSTPLFAPLWVGERAVCSWIALASRARGGVQYAGGRLRVPAHNTWTLRRRLRLRAGRRLTAASGGGTRVAGGGAEADRLVGAVAEGLDGTAPAPAQRDRPPAQVDLLAVGRHQAEGTAHEKWTVDVRRDGDGLVLGAETGHAAVRSRSRIAETDVRA